MPETELTRLTITWSKDTDLALRSHLGAQGLKKGALSKFVEDTVKWRLFDQTVTRVRQGIGDVRDGELYDIIDEAVKCVREEKHSERNRRSHK